MSQRQLLALLVVLSILLVPVAPPHARAAAAQPGETLTAYVAGSDAAWFLSVGNVSVSNQRVASAESVQGLSWYNLTAIRTTTWASDFQMFGPQGYNVLPVPFVPLQGVFFTAGASGYSEAADAAARLGPYLLTTFQSISNSTGVYSFFAPLSFDSVIPATMLKLLPSGQGGFAAALSASKFVGLQSPMVTLEGQRAGSGFDHALVLGSITSSGLDSSSRPSLLKYFGATATSIQAMNGSSSTVAFHFLDGMVVSSDNATLTNDRASFKSSYVLAVSPGARLYGLNATVIQRPSELLATRQVDVGVLKTGDNMSVTISLTNLSNSTSLSGISVSDDWWQGSGLFRLVQGSSDITNATLAAGQSSTPTYVLQFIGNGSRQMSIPPSTVSYSYAVGGSVFSEYASLNGINVSLGADEPVVFAYLAPSGGLGHVVGENQSLKVFVKNVGTRTASSVVVAGRQVGGLSPDGGSTTVDLTASAPSITAANVTGSYAVSYATPEGQTVSLRTNSVPVIFSHSSMRIAFGTLAMNSTVAQLPGGGASLNVTLDFANHGPAALTSLRATYPLPAGLGCGVTGGANLTCNDGVVSLSYSRVLPLGQEHSWISFNVTDHRSFIFPPAVFAVSTSGFNLTGASNAQPAATGLTVTKEFDPSQLFSGMASQVTVSASNGGPFTVYNATFSSTSDSFDQVSGAGNTSKSAGNLSAGSSLSFSYGVSTGSPSASGASAPVAAQFFIGGTPFQIAYQGPRVSVYPVPSVTIVSAPASPIEGGQFSVQVTINNAAPLPITDVQFFLPLPRGISLGTPVNATVSGGGGLSVSVPRMAGGGSFTASVTASADSGQTIPFSGASLSFGYSGASLNGKLPSGGIAIGENVLVRYELPMALVLLALLATAFYVRRLAGATSRASQK